MKKLVLLGDSIRLAGYGKRLAELCSDEYEVWQPDDNCRWADCTYRMLFDYRDNIADADVIHWNNGHWDLCDLFGEGSFTSVENYIKAMTRIAEKLLAITPNVIFSTTTPVTPLFTHQNNKMIKEYNAAIVPVLREMGIAINDLYSFVEPHIDEYFLDDNLHLNELGAEACAEEIHAFIVEKFK